MTELSPKMRDAILMGQRRFIEQKYGRAVLEAAQRTLTAEQRDELSSLMPITWVRLSTVTALKNAIAHEVGIDPHKFNRLVVRSSLGGMVSTVWRALLRQVGDAAIIKRAPILYSKAFSGGVMRVSAIHEGHAELELTGWPTIPEYHRVGLGAGIEVVLEHAGRDDASVTWERDGDVVRFFARWGARQEARLPPTDHACNGSAANPLSFNASLESRKHR